jgi:hypothetical protein
VPHGTLIPGQVVKLMPRAHVESWDKAQSTGRPSRVLSRWRPCGALVFAPLAGHHRLREVATAMASPSEGLALLGVTPPQRSTLAAAQARRPAALYHSLLATLYARCQVVAPGHGVRFTTPRFAVDSTTISRCLTLGPWARFRTTNGASKMPTRLEHAGHRPACVVITAGKRSDSATARGPFQPTGRIVARDRGSIDAQFLCRRPQDGVYCVTRQQVNATFTVTAR